MIYEPRPDIAKKIIENRIFSYFPDFQGQECIVEQVPFDEASTYSLYQFRVSCKSLQTDKYIIVKFAPVFEVNNEGKTEFENLTYLYNRLEASGGNIHVARPLDFLEDINALVTEKVNGDRLGDMLLKLNSRLTALESKEALSRIMLRCGYWLRTFHQLTKQPRRGMLSLEFENNLRTKLGELEQYGFPKKVSQATIDLIHELSISNKFVRLTLARQHGDFGPQNIVVSSSDVYVFDLQRYHPEIIYNDITYFLVTLETMNLKTKYLIYDYQYSKKFQESFIRGYFGVTRLNLDDNDRLLLDVWYLKNLIYRCAKQRTNIQTTYPKAVLKIFDSLKTSKYYPNRVKELVDCINRDYIDYKRKNNVL